VHLRHRAAFVPALLLAWVVLGAEEPRSVCALAFLLRAAEMPSGSTPVAVQRARLAEIRFERRQP